ncbi:MAG TPA: hypothetical protein ENI53_01915 [Thermoplasmatales archaeon]|nr:hypothetical protein [Thermoplasmatales archaeon]
MKGIKYEIICIFVAIFLIFPGVYTKEENISYAKIRGWTPQNSGTTQDLNGISFINESTGTVVGNSCTILHTTDGGNTWNAQTAGPTYDLLDVSFYNATRGVATGYGGTIIYTLDGGNNWITAQEGWMIDYYGVQMVTATTGFIVGKNSIYQPLVEKTTDFWQSWNSIIFYLNGNEGLLSDVCFLNETHGFASARVWNGEGAIVETVDGGASWSVIFWTSNGLNAIDFPSQNVGYAVGSNGIILKTNDGGSSWNFMSSGVTNTLYDVSFPEEETGRVVGSGGLIISTEDGGNSWSVEYSGVSSTLYGVEFVNSYIGFAVGEDGTILKYVGDITPPQTNCTLYGYMENGIYINNVTVFLEATDDLSGVNYTMYKMDDGEWQEYSGAFVVSEKGTHNLTFYSVDNAGNVEEEKSIEFSIGGKIEMQLYSGWNLCTVPFKNNYTASSLFNDIEGCSIVLGWNASIGDFNLYAPGIPNDFPIKDGHGYLIAVKNDTFFNITGMPIENVSVLLYEGWNMLGWFKEQPTTTASLYGAIPYCNIVLLWNTTTGDFDLYAPGVPTDFPVTIGDGFLIAVSQEGIWHGEG